MTVSNPIVKHAIISKRLVANGLSDRIFSDHSEKETKYHLRTFSEFGCHPLFYLDSSDQCLCPVCAYDAAMENVTDNESDPFPIVAGSVNYEDDSLYCCECSDRIPSAYAEDDTEEEQEQTDNSDKSNAQIALESLVNDAADIAKFSEHFDPVGFTERPDLMQQEWDRLNDLRVMYKGDTSEQRFTYQDIQGLLAIACKTFNDSKASRLHDQIILTLQDVASIPLVADRGMQLMYAIEALDSAPNMGIDENFPHSSSLLLGESQIVIINDIPDHLGLPLKHVVAIADYYQLTEIDIYIGLTKLL